MEQVIITILSVMLVYFVEHKFDTTNGKEKDLWMFLGFPVCVNMIFVIYANLQIILN